MKILNKKVKIGKFKNINVYIDWKYLIRERGLRKEETQFQIVLGRFLMLISIVGLLFLFVMDLSLGEFLPVEMIAAGRLEDLVAFGFCALFLYSIFLLRDRNKFFDTLDL